MASEPQPKMTFERWVTIASLCFGAGGMMVTVNNHGSRITKLEADRESDRKAITDFQTDVQKAVGEVRGDVKVLLERTAPK
jgi:hypothetical protein